MNSHLATALFAMLILVGFTFVAMPGHRKLRGRFWKAERWQDGVLYGAFTLSSIALLVAAIVNLARAFH